MVWGNVVSLKIGEVIGGGAKDEAQNYLIGEADQGAADNGEMAEYAGRTRCKGGATLRTWKLPCARSMSDSLLAAAKEVTSSRMTAQETARKTG